MELLNVCLLTTACVKLLGLYLPVYLLYEGKCKWSYGPSCPVDFQLNIFIHYAQADDRMFNGVVINPEHVLHQFLTERQQTYNLRRRLHGSKTLLTKTQSLSEQDFFIRAMYRHSY